MGPVAILAAAALPPAAAAAAPQAAPAATAYGACGVAARAVSVRYDPVTQDDAVRIALPSRAVSDSALSCIVRAARRRGDYLAFSDRRLGARYWGAQVSVSEAATLAEARAWLEAHGKLGALPAFDPRRQTLRDFARNLEALCGFAPGEFFGTHGARLLTVNPVPPEAVFAQEEQFTCAVQAALASDISRHGVAFGFIGNAAAAPLRASRRRR